MIWQTRQFRVLTLAACCGVISIIGVLTFITFDPGGAHESPQVIHVKVGALPLGRYGIMPITKRLANLDALFRDAPRGKKIDVDIEFSGPLLELWAEADVRQGSCWLYTDQGYVRFEPAGAIFARIDSSIAEKRYASQNGASRFWLHLGEGNGAHAELGVLFDTSNIPGGMPMDSIHWKYRNQPLAVRQQTSSAVVRLTFMLSEDFRGKIYGWDMSMPK